MTERHQHANAVHDPVSIVDIGVFETIYRTWAPQIYTYCYRRLGDVDNAEDATSQIFQQAFRGRAGFQGGSVPAWLFRIAERVIIDHYRASKPTVTIELADAMPDGTPGPDLLAIEHEQAIRLQQAIAALPEPRRRVIELRLAGLTSPDIAVLLDRTPEWVRTNQRRAVLQLQAALAPTSDRPEVRDV